MVITNSKYGMVNRHPSLAEDWAKKARECFELIESGSTGWSHEETVRKQSLINDGMNYLNFSCTSSGSDGVSVWRRTVYRTGQTYNQYAVIALSWLVEDKKYTGITYTMTITENQERGGHTDCFANVDFLDLTDDLLETIENTRIDTEVHEQTKIIW